MSKSKICLISYTLVLYTLTYYYATQLWNYYKYNKALDQVYPAECLVESIYQEEITVENECGTDENYVASINVTYQDRLGTKHTNVPSCNFGPVCQTVENGICEKQTCNQTGYDPTSCGMYISYNRYYYYNDSMYDCYVSVSDPKLSSLIPMEEEDYFWTLLYPTFFVVTFFGMITLVFCMVMG